jgi:uncharacterized protein YbjT (DUF2867 family)
MPSPSELQRKHVLVAGATGRLGGVVGTLLERGHRVTAMTRDPAAPAAEALRAHGAEIVVGDFDDVRSIERAAAEVDAVFATGTAHRAGPDGEARHGRNLAEAVAAADVAHLVYVSGDGAAPDSPLPLFRAKFEVEQQIRLLDLPHTILAPTYLMENLLNPWNLPSLGAGLVPSPISVDSPLQQTAVADVVAVATRVIERRDDVLGERIGVASDELTGRRGAAILSRVLGRELEPVELEMDELAPPLRALFGWLGQVGHRIDRAALHDRFADVAWHSYEDWARSQLPRFRQLCPHRPAPVGAA